MLDENMTDDLLEEGDYELDNEVFGPVLSALKAEDAEALARVLDPLHPADIADLLEQLDPRQRAQLVQLYGIELDGEVLSELDESIREDTVAHMAPEVLAVAVRDLETDDVVDLIEDLDEPQTEAVLDALDDDDRVVVEQSLSYPEDSAGRLMQRELVIAPEHWDVGQAIDYMRSEDDLPEQFYHVILIDPRMRPPTGYVTLGRIMGSPREVPLKDLTEDSFRTIPVLQDEAKSLMRSTSTT